MSTMRTILLVASAAVLLIGCGLLEPEPEPWRGVATIDSEAASGEVTLRWFTSTSGGYWDGHPYPDGPPIAGVVVVRSWSGSDGSWVAVHKSNRSGTDSLTVSGLPDGRIVWFQVRAIGASGRVLTQSEPVITMPGAVLQPVFTRPLTVDGNFDWSPTDDAIAYIDASNLDSRHLIVLDLRTLTIERLSSIWGRRNYHGAAWTSDGKFIATTHTPTRSSGSIDYRVHAIGVADRSIRPLSQGRVDFDPTWGASEWIYFCRGTYNAPNIPEISRAPASGGSSSPVTSDPSHRKYHPSARSSDDLIVYEGVPVGQLSSYLYLVSPATGVCERISGTGWADDRNPSWTVDGRSVVFISNRSGHDEVWKLDVEDGSYSQLTRGVAGTGRSCARMSHDGRRLAVFTGAGPYGGAGELEIYDLEP